VPSKTGQVHGRWFLIGSYAYLFSETRVQFLEITMVVKSWKLS